MEVAPCSAETVRFRKPTSAQVTVNRRLSWTVAIGVLLSSCTAGEDKTSTESGSERAEELAAEEPISFLPNNEPTDNSQINEAASELGESDLEQLRQQSSKGNAIASRVLAQQAEKLGDLEAAGHWYSTAMMQGSALEHLNMAIIMSELAMTGPAGSSKSEKCILLERALWHAGYALEHAEDDIDATSDKRWIEEERDAARDWIEDIKAKQKSVDHENECRSVKTNLRKK